MMRTFPIGTAAERKAFVEGIKAQAKVIHSARVQGTNFTQVIMQFPDGWQIQGTSVCVNDADYKYDMGCDIAKRNIMSDADTHYWRIVGYLALIGHTSITIPYEI